MYILYHNLRFILILANEFPYLYNKKNKTTLSIYIFVLIIFYLLKPADL